MSQAPAVRQKPTLVYMRSLIATSRREKIISPAEHTELLDMVTAIAVSRRTKRPAAREAIELEEKTLGRIEKLKTILRDKMEPKVDEMPRPESAEDSGSAVEIEPVKPSEAKAPYIPVRDRVMSLIGARILEVQEQSAENKSIINLSTLVNRNLTRREKASLASNFEIMAANAKEIAQLYLSISEPNDGTKWIQIKNALDRKSEELSSGIYVLTSALADFISKLDRVIGINDPNK